MIILCAVLQDDLKLEDMLWYKSMLKYSANRVNSAEQLLEDIDLELIPKTIEKVVLSKIDRMYTNQIICISLLTN